MKKICGIYKITCTINSKCYIGQSFNIISRWKKHKNLLKANKHINLHLQNAWNKYGEDNFKYEILETISEEKISQSLLNESECYWIKYYKTLDRKYGFNVSEGGSNGNNFAGKSNKEMKILKDKIRNKVSELWKDEEYRKKQRLSHKGQRAWNKGIPQSETSKEKVRKSKIGINSGIDNYKAVKIICITTGEIFGTLALIKGFHGIKYIQNVWKCCNGKRKTCGKLEDGTKLQWQYYEDYLKVLAGDRSD